jgi:hypothetical protein
VPDGADREDGGRPFGKVVLLLLLTGLAVAFGGARWSSPAATARAAWPGSAPRRRAAALSAELYRPAPPLRRPVRATAGANVRVTDAAGRAQRP